MEGGPPVFSADSTCPQILLLRIGRFRFRIRDSHTLRFNFPFDSPTVPNPCLRTTPPVFLPEVWPLPISLATTFGISFDFFSSAYLDVSVRRVPFANLWIQLTILDSSSRGFPHSDIRGSMFISNSPRLFAGNHVLRRLSVPRHSPYALFRLNSFARSHKFRSCLSFANNCLGCNEKTVLSNFLHHCFPPPGFPPTANCSSLFRKDLLLSSKLQLSVRFFPYSVFNEQSLVLLKKQKYLVGLSGLEPPTSRLSGGCSNQLSYKPMVFFRRCPLWWR